MVIVVDDVVGWMKIVENEQNWRLNIYCPSTHSPTMHMHACQECDPIASEQGPSFPSNAGQCHHSAAQGSTTCVPVKHFKVYPKRHATSHVWDLVTGNLEDGTLFTHAGASLPQNNLH